MVLNAFLGSFSVLTVAVRENEGNFSPMPSISVWVSLSYDGMSIAVLVEDLSKDNNSYPLR